MNHTLLHTLGGEKLNTIIVPLETVLISKISNNVPL